MIELEPAIPKYDGQCSSNRRILGLGTPGTEIKIRMNLWPYFVKGTDGLDNTTTATRIVTGRNVSGAHFRPTRPSVGSRPRSKGYVWRNTHRAQPATDEDFCRHRRQTWNFSGN